MNEKRVFVSYCHRDVSEEWIEAMTAELGKYGIDTLVDIYDLQLGNDLNYFMEQIKNVDAVLILLGKFYKEKANIREGGVGIETQIISNEVYKDLKQTKCIPIVISKDENDKAYLPYYLETRYYIDFSNDDLFISNIETLVKHINRTHRREKPHIINISKSEEIVNSYLEDLWDLEMQLDSLKMDYGQLQHLLDVTNRYLQDITLSKQITKDRKQGLLERLERNKNNIQNKIDEF